ncbi:cAMP-dependent protein kinase type II regulatory subunit-like isoform X2 [Lineus longissimus]|uniref:cAMP-dependent protein kinase type II regulatory subunit-like isoform X2 n=1 Tax=Lineus longissimus TaxID=88925 RepID=UPI002B4EE2E8
MENTDQNATTANATQGTRRRENGTPSLLLCCCGQLSSRRIQRQNRNIELEIEGEPPKNRFMRRKSVSAERYDPEADEDDGEATAVFPKSDEQRKSLNEAVKHILLFKSLELEQMQTVIDAMFEKKVEPGFHVIDQGDDGDNFYVILSGTYDIFVEIEGKPKCIGNYDNQGSFGELALMYNMPRAATIVATSNGTLWAMDRSTFRKIVLKNAYNKRKMYETLLENVPMLSTINPYERMNVADALHSKTFEDGDVIIKQGDTADCMYFVEDGEVRITMTNVNDPDTEVELTRCTKGQYFGELALVTHKPRAASVMAVGKTKLAVLDVDAFERLLGPCMEVMKRNIDEYEEQLVRMFGSKSNISDLR